MEPVAPQAYSSGFRRNNMVRSNANISISHTGGGAAAAYPAFESDQDLNEFQSPLSGMKPSLDQISNPSFRTPGNPLIDLSSLYNSDARGDTFDDLSAGFAPPTSDPNSYLALNDRPLHNSGEHSHQNLSLGLETVEASPWSHLHASQGQNSPLPRSMVHPLGHNSQASINGKRPSKRSAASGRASILDSGYSTLSQGAQHEDEVMQDLSPSNMNHMNPDQGFMSHRHGQQSLPEFSAPSQQMAFPGTYTMTASSQQHYFNQLPTTPTRATQTQHRNHMQQRQQTFSCRECEWKGKTRSELNKHNARHMKRFKCLEDDCKGRQKGFPTLNDLDRHLKSVHKINKRKTKDYKCFAKDCGKRDKMWPRLDNFKQHLKSMHGNENMEFLLQQSDTWFEQQQQQQLMSEQNDETESNHPPSHISSSDLAEFNNMMAFNPSSTSHYHDHTTSFYPRTGPPREQQPFSTNAVDPRLLEHQNQYRRARDRGISSPAPPTHMPNPSFPSPNNTETLRIPVMQRAQSQVNHTQYHGSASYAGRHDPVVGFMQTPEVFWDTSMSVASVNHRLRPPASRKRPHTTPNPYLDQDRMKEFITSPLEIDTSTDGVTKADELLANIGGISGVSDLPATSQTPALLISPPDDEPKFPKRHMSKLLEDEIHNFLQQHEARADQERSLSQQEDIIERFRLSLRTTFSNADGSSKSLGGEMVDAGRSPSVAVKIPSHNEKASFPCTVEGCDKIMDKQSALKKHIKRHKRLWGCTFEGCTKVSGSKNDWKRHEQGQHEQQECWRCPQIDCLEVFYHHQGNFINHLKEKHYVKRQDEINNGIKTCRIAWNYQGQFWCGFCNKIIVSAKHGGEAVTFRFDHIDHHFNKEEKSNSSWIELGGFGKTKALLKEEARRKIPTGTEEKDDEISGENDTQDDVDSSSSEELSPTGPLATQSVPLSGEQTTSHHSSSATETGSQGMISTGSLNSDQMAIDPRWVQQSPSGERGVSIVQSFSRQARAAESQMLVAVAGSGSMRSERARAAQFIVCCQCDVPYNLTLSKYCVDCAHGKCNRCRLGAPYDMTMQFDVVMTP